MRTADETYVGLYGYHSAASIRLRYLGRHESSMRIRKNEILSWKKSEVCSDEEGETCSSSTLTVGSRET